MEPEDEEEIKKMNKEQMNCPDKKKCYMIDVNKVAGPIIAFEWIYSSFLYYNFNYLKNKT